MSRGRRHSLLTLSLSIARNRIAGRLGLRLLPLPVSASFHSGRMAMGALTRISRTFYLIPKVGPEGFLLRLLIPDDYRFGGRERPEDIRRANRSSRTEVEHRQCNSHSEARQTNNARDDKDEPFHECSESRPHIRILRVSI